mmetsp:Transcript_17995/g.32865  ORF Transcript_17995/g.32865 Transcript_17995/m.32865 type:complete len:87 (-) Transcript_17995:1438-1698(-)
MKLNRFVWSWKLAFKLNDAVFNVSILVGKAYLFADFHIFPLLSSKEALSQINRMFCYRYLMAVSNSRDRLDTELVKSVEFFDHMQC